MDAVVDRSTALPENLSAPPHSETLYREVFTLVPEYQTFLDLINYFYCWIDLGLPSAKILFLGPSAELRKAPISFVMNVYPSVCLSVCLPTWNNLRGLTRK